MESQYLKCDCEIQENGINTQETDKFNPKLLYKSFYSVLKYSNYKVLKCYKLAFILYSVTKNIGSIIAIVYFIIYLIFSIFYFLKGRNQLKQDFKKLAEEKIEKKKIVENITTQNIEENKMQDIKDIKQDIKPIKKIIKKIKYKTIKRKKGVENYMIKTTCAKRHSPRIKFTNPPKKIRLQLKEHEIDSMNKFIIKNYKNNNISALNKENSLISSEKKEEEKVDNINIQIINAVKIDLKEMDILDNYELNDLEFEEAIKLDKRNFIEIYWSLLKREHLFIFTFITKDDHNIVFIKYSTFFFLLCTDMAMNVFFFSDETMHKMFLDYGKYNFIQQIPQIIYSTIVSKIIETILSYLSFTDKYFYQIKGDKTISKSSVLDIMKCIQIKIAFYFVFTSVMFIFFWYITTCFCSVYRNTQSAFIKDSISSCLLGFLDTLIIYLFVTFLRIIVLKTNKFKKEWIYKLSGIIPLF